MGVVRSCNQCGREDQILLEKGSIYDKGKSVGSIKHMKKNCLKFLLMVTGV